MTVRKSSNKEESRNKDPGDVPGQRIQLGLTARDNKKRGTIND